MEFWKNRQISRAIFVPNSAFYSIFESSIYWNIECHPNMPYVVFVAQSHNHFLGKRESPHTPKNNKSAEGLEQLEKMYRFHNTFGELPNDKIQGNICMVYYESGKISVLESTPKDILFVKFKGGSSLDLLVLKDHSYNYRHGLVYCYNRPIKLVEYAFKNLPLQSIQNHTQTDDKIEYLQIKSTKVLNPGLYTCQGVIMHPSRKQIFFFGREKEFLSHDTSYALCSFDLDTKELSTLVNRVKEYLVQFNGFYSLSLNIQKKGFIHNGDFLNVNTIKNEFREIFIFRTDEVS